MGRFDKILLTSDFDRTLTAADSTVPERNLQAIRYFMEEGGAFTVNTGRSLAMSRPFLRFVPVNAPVLLYNGAAAYDLKAGEFAFYHEIPLPRAQTIRRLAEVCGNMVLELQGTDCHYAFKTNPLWEKFCIRADVPWAMANPDDDSGPFLKVCIFDVFHRDTVDALFHASAEELAHVDAVEHEVRKMLGDSATVLRVAPRTIDVVAPGVSKGKAARQLLKAMKREVLVCVGDEQNDLSMLDEADYSFCPAGCAVADRYPNVCCCDDGAVADVIYNML